MPRIALYQQILVGRLVRGPHVFFPLFNLEYQRSSVKSHHVFYFLKTDNVEGLKKQYKEGEMYAPNIVFLQERHHRFKVLHETLDILWALIRYRISLLHVISYSSSYDPITALKILHFFETCLAPQKNIRYHIQRYSYCIQIGLCRPSQRRYQI